MKPHWGEFRKGWGGRVKMLSQELRRGDWTRRKHGIKSQEKVGHRTGEM
jgi:hypothetical protein